MNADDVFNGHFCEMIDCTRWNSEEIENMHAKLSSIIKSPNTPAVDKRGDTVAERHNKIPAARRHLLGKHREGAYHTHVDKYSASEGFFFDPKLNALVPNFHHKKFERILLEHGKTAEEVSEGWNKI